MTRVTSPLSERFFSRAFTRTMSPASAPLRSLRATSTGRRSSTKSGSATEYFPRRTSIAGSIKRALRSETSGWAHRESTTRRNSTSASQHATPFGLRSSALQLDGRDRGLSLGEPPRDAPAAHRGEAPSADQLKCLRKIQRLGRYIFLKKRVTERKLPITPIPTPTATRRIRVENVFTASLEIG